MPIFQKVQQQLAHTSTVPALGNSDLKLLQTLISSEKDFLKANAKSSLEFKKSAEALKGWSEAEGEDLRDILGKLGHLFEHYANAMNRLDGHLSTIRLHFKSIRTREEALADMKRRKRDLKGRIESVEKKLTKMSPENKELAKTTALLKELHGEMYNLTDEVRAEDAAIGDFKRRTAKEAMGIKCAALLEMAEKVTILADVGKLMIEEIPLNITQPGMPREDYTGAERTDRLMDEATRCIADVVFAPSGPTQGFGRTGGGPHHPSLGAEAEFGASQSAVGLHEGSSVGGGYDHQRGYENGGAYDQDGTLMLGGTLPPLARDHSQAYDLHSNPLQSGLGPQRHDNERQFGSRTSTQLSADGLEDSAADEWGRAAGAALAAVDEDPNPSGADSHNDEDTINRLSVTADPHRDSSRSSAMMWLPNIEAARKASGTPGISAGLAGVGAKDASLQRDHPDVAEGSSLSHAHAYEDSATVMPTSNIPPVAPATPTLSNPLLQSVEAAGFRSSGDYGATSATTGSNRPSFDSKPAASTASAAAPEPTYFQSIGSTRALQESVRKAPGPGTFGGGASTSASASGPPSSPPQPHYEQAPHQAQPYDAGAPPRTITAAAFRRNMARTPSAQHDAVFPGPTPGGSSSRPSSRPGSPAIGGAGPLVGGAAPVGAGAPTAPLLIHKKPPPLPSAIASPTGTQTRPLYAGGLNRDPSINRHLAEEDGLDGAAPPYTGPSGAGAGAGAGQASGSAGGLQIHHHGSDLPPLLAGLAMGGSAVGSGAGPSGHGAAGAGPGPIQPNQTGSSYYSGASFADPYSRR